jgi:hypothetical protein
VAETKSPSVTVVFAQPTKWRIVDERGQVFGFNDKGEMRPNGEMVLAIEDVTAWRNAIQSATTIISAAKKLV